MNLHKDAEKRLEGEVIRWEEADHLVNNLSAAWGLSTKADALEATFKFADFSSPLQFVAALGPVVEVLNHHPDIQLGWGYVKFSITTHSAGGLTDLDFELASAIDEVFLNLDDDA